RRIRSRGKLDARETGGCQFRSQIGFAKDPEFEDRAGATVKHQVVKDLPLPGASAIDQRQVAARSDQAELLQIREMLLGGLLERVGHAHGQESVRFQQGANVGQGLFDWRRDVLEDVAREDEVESARLFGRLRDIETGSLMVKGVAVVKARLETGG